jgi:hypothetical protein
MNVSNENRVIAFPKSGQTAQYSLITIAGRPSSLENYVVDEALLAARIERFVYRRF